MAVIASTPYDSAKLLFGSNIETWLNEDDAKRLAAYVLYDAIYRNYPDTFKLTMRGTNDHPIYIPGGRIIVNTLNRYVGKGFHWLADPMAGDAATQTLIKQVFDVTFKREKFMSKFKSNKKKAITIGDACFYITANSLKPEGTRISIETIDPATVFPIEDEDNPNHYTGVDIVEQEIFEDVLFVKRQRYLKSTHPDHPAYAEDPEGNAINIGGDISYQIDSFEVDGWETTDAKVFRQGDNLPPIIIAGIVNLPVYWWPNERIDDSPWGFSEMAGLETLIAGVNQSASDEDLSLAIAGLGVYLTDAGAPVNEDGSDGTWNLGPAEVVEVGDGKKFERVQGITSITPFLEHMGFLQEQAFRTTGASDVAQGQVEVKMAESGIALQLRMGPILDSAAEKEVLIKDTLDSMFFDLRMWFEVYEGMDFGEYDPFDPTTAAVVTAEFGDNSDKLPEDKEARRKALLEGYNAIPAIFSGSFVRAELRRMGWEMPTDEEMMKQVAQEAEFFTTATEGGEFGDRVQEEATAEETDAGGTQ